MQIARFALRNLWRDLKSGELSGCCFGADRRGPILDRRRLFHQPDLAGRVGAGSRSIGRGFAQESPNPIPARYFE